jgi:hypothetical protein
MKPSRVFACVALAVPALYFAVSAANGLHSFFSLDDGGNLLNMHRCFESSPGRILKSLVDGSYRPLGGVFYLAMWRVAGFHPLPYRAVCFVLMLINVGLAFAVLRRLSASTEAALLGTLLFACHPCLLFMDYNSGYIYEILCFLFYFLALWCYLRWREASAQTPLSWPRTGALLLLAACALDSKEMAVTLPAAFLLAELVYYPPLSSVRRHARAAIATAALTLAAMLQKLLTFNGLSGDSRYGMHFSPRLILEQMCRYYEMLIYQDHFLTIPTLLLLWAAMALAAYGLRSRPMQFGFWFLMVSLAPVSLIVTRAGASLYLPMIGWALYVAALAIRLRDAILRKPAWRRAALAAAGVLIVVWHAHQRAPFLPMLSRQRNQERRVIGQLQERLPHIEAGAFLLFVNDPFPADSWSPLFLTRLAYRDPTIWLDRPSLMGRVPSGEELTLYDHVFIDENGQLREIAAPKPPASHGMISVRFSKPRVKPGEAYTVSIPECAGETIDIAFQTRRWGSVIGGLVRRWCTLDAAGKATLPTPRTMEAGEIQVRRIRSGNGPWLPAEGSIEVVR